MLAGGALGWTVLLPIFDALGDRGTVLGLPVGISGLTASEIWRQGVRYVGAGAVAAGGLVSLVRALPAMQASLRNLRSSLRKSSRPADRTDDDLPGWAVIGGVALLAAALWLVPSFHMGILETVFAILFTFLFVVVSAEIVGLIGTTSQPVSGMTITALLVTAFAILLTDGAGSEGAAAAVRVAAIVEISVALAGDMSQDLKTDALVGATPRYLQIGEMVGTVVAALRAGWVLYLLHQAYGIGSTVLPAPQAKLMATLAEGVMNGNLPWGLLFLGMGIAAVVEVFGVRSLPFAIGLYLPVTTSAALMLGGLAAAFLHRTEPTPERRERLTLLASGLVAGDALMGIGLAALVVSGLSERIALRAPGEGPIESLATLLPFLLMLAVFVVYGRAKAR